MAKMLGEILEHLCGAFEADLGFEGGRIYAHDGDDYVLCCGFGTSRNAPCGLRVPRDYPPHRRLLDEGILLMSRGDAGVDDAFEDAIGVESTFAAIGVGEGPAFIFALSVRGEPQREDVLFSLSMVRHVITLKLQQRRMAGIIDAARIIQESILPQSPPVLADFEIAAAARPAEEVAGDVFDYLPVSDCCLGIAIADSSGHGLPAALLARDVITALRTAAGQGEPVGTIVERVIRVIGHAALARSFVSLFYGQLSVDGVLEYCNAGHDPPLLLSGETLRRLDVGGGVLGPFPGARYESGRERLEPGGMMVLYTDGIPERMNSSGAFYGSERIERRVARLRDRPARLVAESILADVDTFAEGAPARDDMTVVVIRRPVAGAGPPAGTAG